MVRMRDDLPAPLAPTMALSIADRGYVLSTGSIVLSGRADELLHHEDLKRAYLGR